MRTAASWSRAMITAACVAAVLIGCTGKPLSDEQQRSTNPTGQSQGSPSASDESAASPVLWRILSDPYGGKFVRNVNESASVTVFSDGLVAVRTANGVRGIMLTPDELNTVRDQVDHDLRPMPLQLDKPWEVFGDMPITIIRGKVDGAEIEAAAIGVRFAETVANPAAPGSGLTPGFVELDQTLWSLVDQANQRKSVPVAHSLPTVPIIPVSGLYPLSSP